MVLRTLRTSIPFIGADSKNDLAQDIVFEILQNERRRFTLHYLKRVQEPVNLSELIDQIAAWENEKDRWGVSKSERQRVHVSMLQSHLPVMAEAGLVEYDGESRTIELTDKARELDIYLEVVPKGDIDWGEYYLGVTFVNAVILGLVWMDLYPFDALPDDVWIVFVLGVFFLSAVLHHWYQQNHQLGTGDPPMG